MKKVYVKPAMQVMELHNRHAILAGSPDAHDEQGGSGQYAPEFNWQEKALLFGGWDVEWED